MSTDRIIHGLTPAALAELPDASVDAVVTDPPYELGFMGKSWDRKGVAHDPATWREVLRVCKPGAHLDPFLGSGTTALAAKNLGRLFIGVESEAEHIEIINGRLRDVGLLLESAQ